jgi:hypothetical protein
MWSRPVLQGITELSNSLSPEHPLVGMAMMMHHAACAEIPDQLHPGNRVPIPLVLALQRQHLEVLLTQVGWPGYPKSTDCICTV